MSQANTFAFFCAQMGLFVKWMHSGLNAQVGNGSNKKTAFKFEQ